MEALALGELATPNIHPLLHGNHKKLTLGKAMQGESSEEGLAYITSILGRESNPDQSQVILSPSTIPATQHKTLVAKAYTYTSHSHPRHVHLHFTSHTHPHHICIHIMKHLVLPFPSSFSHHNHHNHHWSLFPAER